ncbi:LapA family protein [Candidatus Syntrophocurvum alkaliphilum]|nr:LapA family protein [Candidatus Syntrophocurvum alkaliphilum]
MRGYLIGIIVVIILVTIFVSQNTAPVTISFLNWTSSETSLAIVLLLSLCVGALITFLFDSIRNFSLTKQVQELKQQNKSLKQEINNLKPKTDQTKPEDNTNKNEKEALDT